MRTAYKILNAPTGGNSLGHSSLRFKNVLKVKYEGTGYDIIGLLIPTPGIRQVGFNGTFGLLRFSPDMSFAPGSKVYVYYEI